MLGQAISRLVVGDRHIAAHTLNLAAVLLYQHIDLRLILIHADQTTIQIFHDGFDFIRALGEQIGLFFANQREKVARFRADIFTRRLPHAQNRIFISQGFGDFGGGFRRLTGHIGRTPRQARHQQRCHPCHPAQFESVHRHLLYCL